MSSTSSRLLPSLLPPSPPPLSSQPINFLRGRDQASDLFTYLRMPNLTSLTSRYGESKLNRVLPSNILLADCSLPLNPCSLLPFDLTSQASQYLWFFLPCWEPRAASWLALFLELEDSDSLPGLVRPCPLPPSLALLSLSL